VVALFLSSTIDIYAADPVVIALKALVHSDFHGFKNLREGNHLEMRRKRIMHDGAPSTFCGVEG